MATAKRRRLSAKEKQEIVDSAKCYVCEDLGLDHAGFDGYDLADIDFDHYQTPFGNVGGSSPVLPIHAATGGSIPDEKGYETSKRRNCHRLRRNDYSTRKSYVDVMRARLEARDVEYVDDVFTNADRIATTRKYTLPVKWKASEAEFMGKTYPVIEHERAGKKWRRFLTTLPVNLVFTDDASQVRPAAKKPLLAMVQTFLVDGYPMYSPINARIDKCGHVVIFDGNHRATADALAFGVENEMPVLIWDIEPGDKCALRPDVVARSEAK